MKKAMALLALIMAVTLLCSACSDAPKSAENAVTVVAKLPEGPALVGDIPCEFPLAKEPSSLNILTCSYEGVQNEDVFVWQKYEQMTGVYVNWTATKRGERSEAVYKR